MYEDDWLDAAYEDRYFVDADLYGDEYDDSDFVEYDEYDENDYPDDDFSADAYYNDQIELAERNADANY